MTRLHQRSYQCSNNAFCHPLLFEHGSWLKFKPPFMENYFMGSYQVIRTRTEIGIITAVGRGIA